MFLHPHSQGTQEPRQSLPWLLFPRPPPFLPPRLWFSQPKASWWFCNAVLIGLTAISLYHEQPITHSFHPFKIFIKTISTPFTSLSHIPYPPTVTGTLSRLYYNGRLTFHTSTHYSHSDLPDCPRVIMGTSQIRNVLLNLSLLFFPTPISFQNPSTSEIFQDPARYPGQRCFSHQTLCSAPTRVLLGIVYVG